ncbi:MAG: carbon starvation protein A [Armatimonadetes bacterium]|nr:carbon starvation protein A [Armatimonadota bacterium]
MNALPLVLGSLCILAIAYRYYSGFIAARVLMLDDARPTPAHTDYDGQNYYPTQRWVLFGHHFAAITGAGPLIGPVLAAQFGFLPGFLWLLIGVCLAGAVQDFVILVSSVRRKGRSLAEIARSEISPVSGVVASVAVLFIVVIALAGLGKVVVMALMKSPWGVFTVGLTVPIALVVGLYMHRFRKGRVAEATVIGVAGLCAAVVIGGMVPGTPLGSALTLSETQVTLWMAAYGLVASILPVWMLLCPRDYLSAFMKIGTVAALAFGVIAVAPELRMPPITPYTEGGGPIIPGSVFPFVFITIACGAISGFHALVGSGTTPKMLNRESDARPIAYGAMLCEGFIGIMCLVAACSLAPADYFAINVPPARFAALNMQTENLDLLSRQVGEELAGRTGGAVSLAVGMAQIFSQVPFLPTVLDLWYHFAIMFEALFVLSTIDTGTRVARFILQEFVGRVWRPFGNTNWMPGTVISSLLIVGSWTFFILTGSISTIWPMFGVANQLLAVVALAVGTTVLINEGRGRYAWVTALPMCFVAATTLTAGYRTVMEIFLPQAGLVGNLNAALTTGMMLLTLVILGESVPRWYRALSARSAGSAKE